MATNNNGNNGNGTQKIDINSATPKDIAGLPFMNEQRARLVTDYIANNGPIEDIKDVDDIPGIGTKLAHLLADYCQVGNSQGQRKSSSAE